MSNRNRCRATTKGRKHGPKPCDHFELLPGFGFCRDHASQKALRRLKQRERRERERQQRRCRSWLSAAEREPGEPFGRRCGGPTIKGKSFCRRHAPAAFLRWREPTTCTHVVLERDEGHVEGRVGEVCREPLREGWCFCERHTPEAVRLRLQAKHETAPAARKATGATRSATSGQRGTRKEAGRGNQHKYDRR